jgi:hypothetical protein
MGTTQETDMKNLGKFALALFLALGLPTVASAQYRDLDTALANLARGFGSGDTQAIVAGMADGDKVMLQFPGLVEQSGFYGRDQATYILEGLFSKAKPTGFEQENARKATAEGQYYITGTWTVAGGTRELYITLRNKNDRWAVVSLRSGSK